MRGGTSQYRRPGIAQWLDWVAAFAICIAVSPAAAEAQEQAEFNYRSFCTALDSKALENMPTHDTVLYQYQTMLYEAAGVTPQDSPEVAYERTKVFLNTNAASLVCNIVNFNPRNGNIYKLAVACQADGFINDALDNWHVDLNQVDATDGKTVLDYITDRRATAGPTFARILDRYYARFRAAGARHASELR
jgi:hypothetical protein